MAACPLCSQIECNRIDEVAARREVLHCTQCDLRFIPPQWHLSIADERGRYLLHKNCSADVGYRSFLEQLLVPVTKYVSSDMHGLDFGSGPTPVLSRMFREAGVRVDDYDPIFSPVGLNESGYDFVVSSEVFEHFREPASDIEKVVSLVKPDGILGVMTQQVPEEFSTWHYVRDRTHLAFYSGRCMEWIANRFGLRLLEHAPNVWIFARGTNN